MDGILQNLKQYIVTEVSLYFAQSFIAIANTNLSAVQINSPQPTNSFVCLDLPLFINV